VEKTCYYNTIRQVAAAFWGVDRQPRTGLIFYHLILVFYFPKNTKIW